MPSIASVALAVAGVLATSAFAGCARGRSPSTSTLAPPPRADFLVETDDSTFWVTTDSGSVRVRGVPLILARYGGRFYELYTADDDFSYEDALLLGQRLYRRDLLTDDSAAVFVDSMVPRIAARYAKAHPDEQPLTPDEDVDPDAPTSATAEIDILDVFGPYLSYEYHVDVSLPRRDASHVTRRGVLDLRDGRAHALADLFGADAARAIVDSGRTSYDAERDSLLRAAGRAAPSARAAAALRRLQFNERTFTLDEDNGDPMVTFNLGASSDSGGGQDAFDLTPVRAADAPWWRDVRATLPTTDDEGNDAWLGAGYRVIARYDTSGHEARLSIADSSRREWPIVSVAGPVRHIDWLDRPAADPATVRALMRAFDEAATYDQGARVASLPRPAARYAGPRRVVQ